MAADVDSELLTFDNTVFRHYEDDNMCNIPGLEDMPDVIINAPIKHRSVFSNELSASRKIKCEPLHLTVKEGVPLLPKCRRARVTPLH